jgi:hypothetical protein
VQIIPRAIDYFTGKALEYESMDDDDDDYEDTDDDDDEGRFEDEVCVLDGWSQHSIDRVSDLFRTQTRTMYQHGDAVPPRVAVATRRTSTPRNANSSKAVRYDLVSATSPSLLRPVDLSLLSLLPVWVIHGARGWKIGNHDFGFHHRV